jgi:hypothetical protein
MSHRILAEAAVCRQARIGVMLTLSFRPSEPRARRPSRGITEDGLQQRVGTELANLPEIASVVFTLRFDENNWPEIAAHIGGTDADARNIYALTCDALREALDESARRRSKQEIAMEWFVSDLPDSEFRGLVRAFAAGYVGNNDPQQESFEIIQRAERQAAARVKECGGSAIANLRYETSLANTSLPSAYGTVQLFACIVYGEAVAYEEESN